MKTTELDAPIENIAQAHLDRRKFFRKAGFFGLGAAASGFALSSLPAKAQASSAQSQDTVAEMFTAFLIAEDLATTFYYNGLIGPVIQDPNLAGPGGTATIVRSTGNFPNVNYLQAAAGQEAVHAEIFRGYLRIGRDSSVDPYQTFYFPAGTFDTLSNFLGILNALENAFIGAYLTLVQELSQKAALAATGSLRGADAVYSASDYQLFGKVAASIMGVECEHRVLGRVIGNLNPANNLLCQQTDGLTSIYNGTASAVVALTPFLTPSTGPGYSLATAMANLRIVDVDTTGARPTS